MKLATERRGEGSRVVNPFTMATTKGTRSDGGSNTSLFRLENLPQEARNLVAGGLAGMVAKSFVAPIDRIKIMYQITSAHFRIRDVPDVALKIIKEEGFTALWKGNTATLIRVFPYSGIQFMVFDRVKTHFLTKDEGNEAKQHWLLADQDTPRRSMTKRATRSGGLTPFESLISGMTAGAVSVMATYPLDLTRAQLAVLKKKKKDKSGSFVSVLTRNYTEGVGRYSVCLFLFCLGWRFDFRCPHGQYLFEFHLHLTMYACALLSTSQGMKGLYRGIAPTLLGILPYSGVAFTINEQAKKQIAQVTGREPTTIERMQCGALAGLVAQSMTYPLEVTRRRMQTIGIVRAAGTDAAVNVLGGTIRTSKAHRAAQTLEKDPTMLATLTHVLREQGLRGLFKGVSMNWVKGPVAFSISFTTFDIIKKKLTPDPIPSQ